MKKEIIIIILILLLITTLNIITQNYTKESVENLKIKLNEISKQIDKDEVNEENIKKITEDIFVMWKKYKGKLEYYIEHDELEKIESELFEIKGYIEEKNYEETVPKIENTIFILEHIEEKYNFMFKNIF